MTVYLRNFIDKFDMGYRIFHDDEDSGYRWRWEDPSEDQVVVSPEVYSTISEAIFAAADDWEIEASKAGYEEFDRTAALRKAAQAEAESSRIEELERTITELRAEVEELKQRNGELGWIVSPDRMGQ